ncbi:MAG: DUF6172 family protein [Akkermansiaceae bacterium]|nr:DUF6172 family protein [Akkermansiaceae bacterium]
MKWRLVWAVVDHFFATKRALWATSTAMKKLFPMEDPKHKPARVVEGIKADVRKYLKRERRKELPEGVDFWDFDCRSGKDAESAGEVHVSKIIEAVDAASHGGWEAVYIEILAKPGHRVAKEENDAG